MVNEISKLNDNSQESNNAMAEAFNYQHHTPAETSFQLMSNVENAAKLLTSSMAKIEDCHNNLQSTYNSEAEIADIFINQHLERLRQGSVVVGACDCDGLPDDIVNFALEADVLSLTSLISSEPVETYNFEQIDLQDLLLW